MGKPIQPLRTWKRHHSAFVGIWGFYSPICLLYRLVRCGAGDQSSELPLRRWSNRWSRCKFWASPKQGHHLVCLGLREVWLGAEASIAEEREPLEFWSQLWEGLPRWLSGKESACQCRSSIPGVGRSPGEVNGSPLQYSCLGNCMNRGAWGDCKKSDMT